MATAKQVAGAIIDTALAAPFASARRQVLGAFYHAASELQRATLGADGFAVELADELEHALECLQDEEIAQAERDYQRQVLGEE